RVLFRSDRRNAEADATMSLEAAIRAELLDHQEIRDIVGERILLGRVPEEFALPAITAQMISERSLQTLRGLTDVREAAYRLDLWAEDDVTVRRLLDLCRRALVGRDRKSTRLNSSHVKISYAVFCLKKKTNSRERRAALT